MFVVAHYVLRLSVGIVVTHLMVFLLSHCGHVMLLYRSRDACNAIDENKRLIV